MIEFFFDCSSPWTYLGFHNIQPLAGEFGVEISWRPILVGGIFNSINPSVYASREHPVQAKLAYQKKDMADWARSAGLTIKMRPTVFPVNSVKAMRGCIFLAPEGKLVSFARAALLAATALALFNAPFTVGDAAAGVGVTSATDGDPLGKQPQEAERVLRIVDGRIVEDGKPEPLLAYGTGHAG